MAAVCLLPLSGLCALVAFRDTPKLWAVVSGALMPFGLGMLLTQFLSTKFTLPFQVGHDPLGPLRIRFRNRAFTAVYLGQGLR